MPSLFHGPRGETQEKGLFPRQLCEYQGALPPNKDAGDAGIPPNIIVLAEKILSSLHILTLKDQPRIVHYQV